MSFTYGQVAFARRKLHRGDALGAIDSWDILLLFVVVDDHVVAADEDELLV